MIAIVTFLVGLGFIVGSVLLGLRRALDDDPATEPGVSGKVIATVGVIVGLLIIVFSFGWREIGPGQVGVKTQFGQVQDGTLSPGLNWIVPFAQDITIFDSRVQAYRFDNIEGATRDLQTAGLSGLINYHIEPQRADELLQNVGGPEDYAAKVFLTPANTALKEITPQYNASEVVSKRDEIGTQTLERLAPRMERYGIIIDRVSVENIGLKAEFLASVEAKQIAEQDLLRANFEQQRQVKLAEGERDAAVTRAEGEAEANRLINESLSDNLLTWRYIDKLADNIRVMLLPSDSENFILDLQQITQE